MNRSENVLLVGNGINNIRTGYTWKDLVNELIAFTGAGTDPSDNKPFPLLYEEIFLEAVRKKKMREKKVKEYISNRTRYLLPNRVHDRIMQMQFSHLLTTNYDHSLERAAAPGKGETGNRGKVKEVLYNLLRHSVHGRTKLWHIHGECSSPSSITLGYEHYSGYLQRMRNYVVSGTDEHYRVHFDPLIQRWPKLQNDSWVDLFFTHNISIIGLTLDFVEMHLWWLLTFRARWKHERGKKIKNTITYFYPGQYEKAIRHKLELFRSVEVRTAAVGRNHTEDYYMNVLDRVNRQR